MTTEEEKIKNDLIAHLSVVEKELISEVSKSDNQKLMDLFLDFQETRNKINLITIRQWTKSFESFNVASTHQITDNGRFCECEYPVPQATLSETCQTCHKLIRHAIKTEGIERCNKELFVQEYFGLPSNVNEYYRIIADFGIIVNLLAMFEEKTTCPTPLKNE